MIKTKLGNVIASLDSRAMMRLANLPLPIKTSFRLKSIIDQCNKLAERYEEARREVFVNKYNAVVDNIQQRYIFDPPESEMQAVSETQELLTEDVEINAEPFGMHSFASSTNISTVDLMNLSWLIQTPDTDAPIEVQADSAVA